MSDDRERAALIGLLRGGLHPWHVYAEQTEQVGSALAILEGRAPELNVGTEERLFDAPEPQPEVDLDSILAEIEEWRDEGIEMVTVLDHGYPENLRTIYNRPPILFIRGELIKEDTPSVAIVGTREASAEGIENAREIAGAIASDGYTVVSGLARGIDTASHRAALDLGGRTVAVIGSGLRHQYPKENADLQDLIAERAAVVSQFFPSARPTKRSFPMRNVVMSGLALATVVIEASGTSGARMQARFALEHNRPVFLHERLLTHEWAAEYAELPGTYVISRADQVLTRIERLYPSSPSDVFALSA